MNILAFSDVHVHPFKQYATVTEDGINSRLADAFSCLDQIEMRCRVGDIGLVLCGGDLFHVRKYLSVQAFNGAYDRLKKIAVHAPLVIIPGNHDQVDKNGNVHSIHAFNDFATVLYKPGWYTVVKYSICAIPGSTPKEKIKELVTQSDFSNRKEIFLGHFGLIGAVTGSDFVLEDAGISIHDLNTDRFSVVLLGDYHKHQQMGLNAWYIGATHQHTWGDIEQNRGYIIYDDDKGKLSHFNLMYPKFIKTKKENLSYDMVDSFVKIISPEPPTAEDLEIIKDKYRLRSVEWESNKKEEEIEARRDFNETGTSIIELLRSEIARRVEDDERRQRLVDLGKRYLEESQ